MALSNWDTAGKEEGSLYVVLLISRNKDNRNVENFTERKQSFVYHSVNPKIFYLAEFLGKPVDYMYP